MSIFVLLKETNHNHNHNSSIMKKSKATSTEKKVNVNKEALIILSDDLRLAQQLCKFPCFGTINQALIHYYKLQAQDMTLEFKTFNQWKELGCKIVKGSKAVYVWGSKREGTSKDAESEKESSFQFFPTCALFSSAQVELPEVDSTQN
jgi:hypothetical protein